MSGANPWRAGASTFAAFLVVGTIPLVTFVVDGIVPNGVPNAFLWSSVLTGAAFSSVGALKSRFVDQPWWRAGAETFAVGGIAALAAYAIGAFLGSIA